MENRECGVGSKRHKSSLSKSSHRHLAGRRASIAAEPEVHVITPANKSGIDAVHQTETPSRRRSSSLGSFSEGSGGESRRTSAGSEQELRPSKGPSVTNGEAASPNLAVNASAVAHSLRRSAHGSVGGKRRSSSSKTSSSSSSSSSSKKTQDKQDGANEETGAAKAHAEKVATKASSPSGRTHRASTSSITGPSTAAEGVRGAAGGHAERKPSHDVGRSKSSSEKDVPTKTHTEKDAAKSRTSSSSARPRSASTASIGGPAVASHLTPAATPPQDQARPATGPHVAAKVAETTSDHTSAKDRPHSSSSTRHGGRASIDYPAPDAQPTQKTTGPSVTASSKFHKGQATSSAVSDGPAVVTGSHAQAPAGVPQAEKAASKAHAPGSKPFDATTGAPTTTSQNGPPFGIAVPAGIEETVAPCSSHDGKAPSSAPSKDQPAGPSATSTREGDKMAHRGWGTGKGAPQQGHPPAGIPGPHPPASAQTARVIVKKQSQGTTKKKGDDTASHTGPASETFSPSPAGPRLKDGVGSSGHWSFYAMNVSFVTEVDERELRLLYGAVTCVCAIMFSVIVTVVALIVYAKPGGSPLACVTAECIAARAYLAGLLNASVDACSDFYGYVCDSWVARGRDGGSFHRDSVEASVARINGFLRSQEKPEGDAADFRLARILYRECHRYASERSPPAALAATLERAREQLNWAEIRTAPSYSKLVELLVRTSLLVGFHTVLVLQLLTEDSDAVLRLSSGASLLRKLTTTGDGRDLEETLRRSALYEQSDLNKTLEMDDLVSAALEGDRNSSGTTEEGDVDGPLEEFLDDLVPDVNATGWIREILGVLSRFGENSLFLSDVAAANGATRFRRAFGEITSNGGLENAALYLASHLDAQILSLELSRARLSSEPEGATRFCLPLMQRTLAFSWPRLAARVLQVPGTERVLEATFDQLKKVSHQATMLKWLSTPMRLAAQQRIRLVGLVVASLRMSSMAAAMNDGTNRYARLVNELAKRNDSFVELYVKTMALVHGVRVRSPPTRAELEVPLWEQRSELAYSWITTSVVVPTLYQLAPYFYPIGVPAHFNYATVGALLATAIEEAVAPVISPPNETGRGGHRRSDAWWTRGAMRKYRVSAACFERMHSRLGLQGQLDGSGERQRHWMLLRAQGLRLAYDALLASIGKSVTDSEDLQKLWPEAQAEFFARFCLLSCDADPSRSTGPLSPRASCLVALHNMPEFGTAFDCASRDNFVTQQCLP